VANRVAVAIDADAKVEGQFVDAAPAVTLKGTGKGQACYSAFLPGLTYFKPALPKRPVDRSSRDDSLCHLVPSNFDPGAARLIGSLADFERPVLASDPLVETTIIEAKQGTCITLNNWSGRPIKHLQLTLNLATHDPAKEVSLASGKLVHVSRKTGKPVFTLDLEIADALILR